MAAQKIQFDDGATYDRMMGHWSRLVGEFFLDWLALEPGLRCVDVGCGNGAFSELLVERCAPREVHGIDPSADQIAFARERHKAQVAQFQEGDALAVPFAECSFDAALMALVIFLIPDPAKSVAEMTRIVRPGGVVATYAWDLLGGGSPTAPVQAEIRAAGFQPLRPASSDASRMDILRALWANAGLENIETREITVQRSFADFEEFWTTTAAAETITPVLAKMSPADVERVKARVRAKLSADTAGRITYESRANAIKGHVPK
jgi:SAM-dependent methyltransferase